MKTVFSSMAEGVDTEELRVCVTCVSQALLGGEFNLILPEPGSN